MASCVEMRVVFPLGRYHATPWDRNVNDGEVEWPPSPWRIARALYSVWKERCPELDEAAALAAIEYAAAPPTYLVPPTARASTRHYFPTAAHRSGSSKETSKVLDAFVAVDPTAELLIRWTKPIAPEAFRALDALTEHLTYLGRADSQCIARIERVDLGDSDDEGAPDHAGVHGGLAERWIPDPDGSERVFACEFFDEAVITTSTDGMRNKRYLTPPGATWKPYRREALDDREATRRPDRDMDRPTVVVLAIDGRPVPPATHTLVATEWVRGRILRRLEWARQEGHIHKEVIDLFSGHQAQGEGQKTERRLDGHRHPHFLPVFERDRIANIVVWAPEGLGPEELRAITGVRVAGPPEEGRSIRGIANFQLTPWRIGDGRELPPVIGGTSLRWRSRTPFVPARFQKDRRYSGDRVGRYFVSFLQEEVSRELASRGLPNARVAVVDPPGGEWFRRFRRYRIRDRLADQRQSVALELTFDEEVSGPIALGLHSHFGLGLFEPVD